MRACHVSKAWQQKPTEICPATTATPAALARELELQFSSLIYVVSIQKRTARTLLSHKAYLTSTS